MKQIIGKAPTYWHLQEERFSNFSKGIFNEWHEADFVFFNGLRNTFKFLFLTNILKNSCPRFDYLNGANWITILLQSDFACGSKGSRVFYRHMPQLEKYI